MNQNVAFKKYEFQKRSNEFLWIQSNLKRNKPELWLKNFLIQ